MDRNENLGLWTYETPRPDDTPRPSLVKFSIKLNNTGQPIRHKVRVAIRGDLMKPGSEFNPAQTSSQTPSHTAFRLFIALGAAQDLPINFLDVPGAYPRAHADPACRQTMLQPPRSNGQLKHPGKVCVMQRAMTGAPNAGHLWERKCEEDLARLGWTVLDAEPSAYYIASGKDWA
jgi:Reverse transcriptase (RNA-dependent DNA polymerase)